MEIIIFLVVVIVFSVLVKRPGGYQDSVSQAIKTAPTQQAAEQTFWSNAGCLVLVGVVVVFVGLSMIGGIVAESESQSVVMDGLRSVYRVQPQKQNAAMPTEIPIPTVVLP